MSDISVSRFKVSLLALISKLHADNFKRGKDLQFTLSDKKQIKDELGFNQSLLTNVHPISKCIFPTLLISLHV